MTIRLNNDMRDQIISSVLAATDLDDERRLIQTETEELAATLCRAAQPPGWFDLVKDKPAQWFKLESQVSVPHDLNPLAVLGDTPHYYKNWQIDYPAPIPVALGLDLSREDCEKHFGELRKRADEWAERRAETRGALRTFLLSCRTVEQVERRMPELKKHIPQAAQTYPLVAPSNVLAQLTRLGFDRTVAA